MKTESKCSYSPCNNLAKWKGLCPGHYQQKRRGSEMTPLRGYERTKGPDRPCGFDGCPNPVKSRGWCNGHYMQWRRGAELKPVAVRHGRNECSVGNCPKMARDYSSGNPLCSAHHQRWRRYGDPTYAPKLDVVPVGMTAIKDAVANRDRSRCWTDWADLPCWEGLGRWGGAFRNGYPILGGRLMVMHLVMEADGRPQPPAPGNYGLHSCDNRRCWNPNHLRWGTHVENLADRTGKMNYCQHCAHCNP